MKSFLHVVAVAAVFALAVTASAVANQGAYADPSGDSSQGLGTAPDITTVNVNDDFATGIVTITVTTADSLPTDGDWEFWVNIDLDKNVSTGDPDDGTEAWLGAGLDIKDGYWWTAERWNGSDWVDLPVPSMRSRHGSSTEDWTFNKTDLGITTGFNFNVATYLNVSTSGGMTIIHIMPRYDYAPDSGMWTYDLSTSPPPPPAPPAPAPAAVKPVIGAPIATAAVAGKQMTVTFPVKRSDNGAPLLKGTMTCDPSVSGKALAHRESFAAGKAKLVFTVPKAAKGKLLKVKVTISSSGLAATKVATFKVR